jgi:hypothetical protein
VSELLCSSPVTVTKASLSLFSVFSFINTRSCYVAHASLKLFVWWKHGSPASAFGVLGLQTCVTTSSSQLVFYFYFLLGVGAKLRTLYLLVPGVFVIGFLGQRPFCRALNLSGQAILPSRPIKEMSSGEGQ